MTAVYPLKQIGHIANVNDTYTFSSQPRALVQHCGSFRARSKFRDDNRFNEAVNYGNIMYDRRVVRGSNIPRHTVSIGTPMDRSDVQKQFEVRRRVVGRRPVRAPVRSLSPPPIKGRQHIEVQTELFLEELNAAVKVLDESSQTDPFLDRPSTPLFIPAKTGVDMETQIYEGELFDFDFEVTPLLEVIVGKTVEQSLLEVMEEEELAALREQQRRFEEIKNAQLVEQQRLKEQERRYREEKERRIQHHLVALRNQQETAEKVAALAFTQNYLADLAPAVFQTLVDSKFFFDPVERDIERAFMPWLMNQVASELNKIITHRAIVDEFINEFVTRTSQNFVPLEMPVVSKESLSDVEFEEIALGEDELSVSEEGVKRISREEDEESKDL